MTTTTKTTAAKATVTAIINNQVTITGNIGKNGVVAYPANGTTNRRVNFSLGHNIFGQGYNGTNGNVIATDWYDCTGWEEVGDAVEALNLQKGDYIQAIGSQRLKEWKRENADGTISTGTTIQVKLTEVNLLSRNKKVTAAPEPVAPATKAAASSKKRTFKSK